jgi:predicted CopG family antitoxin
MTTNTNLTDGKIHKHINHTNSKVSQTKGKNLRLSFNAWAKLRRMKFEGGFETYSDVILRIIQSYKGIEHLNDDIRLKPPTDNGDHSIKQIDTSDKTIVVTEHVHKEINLIKMDYMLEKGFSDRGPNSVSISDIIIELIDIYKKSL